ncbi:unnamed protein product [Effrenium voratum]|nr:unnamed protein product [Effrenium voratum]
MFEVLGHIQNMPASNASAAGFKGKQSVLTPAPRYAARLSSLLRVGGRILLVAVQYDQNKLPYDRTRYNPPPFSVTQQAVKRLFPEPSWSVTLLELEPCKDEFVERCPSFKKYGVQVRDVVFLIEKKSEGGSSRTSVIMLAAGAAALLSGLAACGLRAA